MQPDTYAFDDQPAIHEGIWKAASSIANAPIQLAQIRMDQADRTQDREMKQLQMDKYRADMAAAPEERNLRMENLRSEIADRSTGRKTAAKTADQALLMHELQFVPERLLGNPDPAVNAAATRAIKEREYKQGMLGDPGEAGDYSAGTTGGVPLMDTLNPSVPGMRKDPNSDDNATPGLQLPDLATATGQMPRTKLSARGRGYETYQRAQAKPIERINAQGAITERIAGGRLAGAVAEGAANRGSREGIAADNIESRAALEAAAAKHRGELEDVKNQHRRNSAAIKDVAGKLTALSNATRLAHATGSSPEEIAVLTQKTADLELELAALQNADQPAMNVPQPGGAGRVDFSKLDAMTGVGGKR